MADLQGPVQPAQPAAARRRSAQPNLCTEITLNTNKDEIAVCNLGSINTVNHIVDGKLDAAKLERTVRTAVRMLDNVIDINYYSVPQAQNANFKHRPVGLGIMGFRDALYLQHIAYGSDAAIDFADKSMEAISYFAIQASCDPPTSAAPTPASKARCGPGHPAAGFPADPHRGPWPEVHRRRPVRIAGLGAGARARQERHPQLQHHGHRPDRDHLQHRWRVAVHRADVPEPVRQIEPVRRVHRDQPVPVHDLKARGLWDPVMVNDLKYYDGSVQQIERIPQDLKDMYATAFEVETKWIVDAASRRQKWIDRAQSLNLYIAGASGKKLDVTYRMASVPWPENHLLPPCPGRDQHRSPPSTPAS